MTAQQIVQKECKVYGVVTITMGLLSTVNYMSKHGNQKRKTGDLPYERYQVF